MWPYDLDSVAGSVIQATGFVEDKDGSKIGNQPDAGNRIQTMSEIRMTRGRVNQVPLGADISPIC